MATNLRRSRSGSSADSASWRTLSLKASQDSSRLKNIPSSGSAPAGRASRSRGFWGVTLRPAAPRFAILSNLLVPTLAGDVAGRPPTDCELRCHERKPSSARHRLGKLPGGRYRAGGVEFLASALLERHVSRREPDREPPARLPGRRADGRWQPLHGL